MTYRFCCLTSVLALTAGLAQADSFNRIASFPTHMNIADGDHAVETSAEIIAATADGMTLVYTDSPLGVIGRIDITDPANPAPLGNVDMNGEPTSVGIVGNAAFVGVNTSESYTAPSGRLAVVDIVTGEELASCELPGQPDSIAVAKDGSFVAIAIENERDEDLGDGRTGQLPAGALSLVQIADGVADCGTLINVTMTDLAEISPEDPEPEFVDINSAGDVIVSMQENNHMVVVGRDGVIKNHFSAGTVDLENIDATDERAALLFTESQSDLPREPDAVKWIDDTHFATANEGDMDGGTRGWTIFNADGTVVYDAGTSFEYAVVQAGHYPDKRSDSKGVEPESIETATFGDTPMVFVGAERASMVGVYDVSDLSAPVLTQLLPSGIGPEGYVAIPSRNLLVSANEVDLIADGGVRSHVMIFEYSDAEATYPMITSAGADSLIGWGALSGLAAVDDTSLVAVNDSFYSYQPTIFTVDVSATPAQITSAIPVTRGGYPAQKMDMEGIAVDGQGGYWIASEGRIDRNVPHAIYHVDAEGAIDEEIGLPNALLGVQKRFGFEGITLVGDTLWMAVQREWEDDAAGLVKLVAYNLETEEWGAVHYPLETPETGWIGLSEIVAQGDYVYLIERDNQIGANAVIKQITRVSLDQMVPAPLGSDLPVVTKDVVRDLIPDLTSTGGYVLDKIEGLTFTPNGTAYVVTDNDGVDDHSGETMFWALDGLSD
ncbi:alkaline phosphatase [Loktanella sp. D2R18]|uniref:esterase-like activity of phytase family protein n=1 Tax=Rhodobacterales TaxID=204455 RepID=UPI000DE8B360|nr:MULTISPECIES: esterase-like activity of phytase family protein [Rhodobacterales]MDO6589615.1 esterase-like activity of phytase family protein [Yoonia sp. 1_MG-2023]RBW44251.1 alkaline phosphatase [Loktanella sp. D2R18]